MITSPNAYFTTEEARRIGARPIFSFTISPFYFNTAVASGSGTYSDCVFVAPSRIAVDYQTADASWTSPEIIGNMETWPASVTVSWTSNDTGYDLVVEYRTATTSGLLAAAAWLAMTNGGDYDFYQYYQWRLTWTGIRSWAFDSVSADPLAAFAVDSYDPEDPDQSYATDGDSLIAYVEAAAFAGEFTIPESDVLDAGALALDAPIDFGDMVSGDHTLVLINPPPDPANIYREGRYSPGHANFIFADEDDWYLKNLRIYFGWKRPGTEIVDSILLYEGIIVTWGPVDHKMNDNGQLQSHTVEIYSRNKISYLLDCQVGVPESDGTPNPVVYGTAFQQADQLAGEMIGDPNLTAYFESGALTEFAHTYTDVGGTISASASNPATGNYCCRSTTSGSAGSYAYGVLSFPGFVDRMFISFKVRFDTYPSAPYWGRFCKIIGNSIDIEFAVSTNGRIFFFNGVSTLETDWYVDDYAGSWRNITIGIFGNSSSGSMKLWVDGNEVYSDEGNYSGLLFQEFEIGMYCHYGEDAYDISFDDVELWNDWYPEIYQLPGEPFVSIDSVYIDGSLRVQSSKSGIVSRIVAGRKPDAASIDLQPAHGAVIFTDPENLPSGDVMIRATKNDIAHPVDVIQSVMGLANCADFVDSTSFAAAKAEIPDDLISVYADDTSAGDIIREVSRNCLLLCWMEQDKFKIKPYLGEPPVSSVYTVTEAEIIEISETVDMESLKTKINVRYGWYDRNNKLYYECEDTSLGAKVGDLTESLDLSWGASVVTESHTMAREKADWLLNRKSGGVSKLSLLGPLSWIRLEIGDNIIVNSPFVRDNEVYIIYSKSVRCMVPYGVELTALKFLGES